jgi:hypothetical protein
MSGGYSQEKKKGLSIVRFWLICPSMGPYWTQDMTYVRNRINFRLFHLKHIFHMMYTFHPKFEEGPRMGESWTQILWFEFWKCVCSLMWQIGFPCVSSKEHTWFQPKFEMGVGVGVNRVSKNVESRDLIFDGFYNFWKSMYFKLLTLMVLYKSLLLGPRSPIWSHDSEVVQFCAPTHIKVYIHMFHKHTCKITFFKLQQLRWNAKLCKSHHIMIHKYVLIFI